MPLSQPQLLSIIITPMVTGSISTVASATIIVSIFRSNVKLSTIYRRFIFAISVFDVLQSISQGLSTIPMPADDVYWGSSGNAVTCGLQGFTTVLGVNGVSWYNLSLVRTTSSRHHFISPFLASSMTIQYKAFSPCSYIFNVALFLL
jgi:hypothetical protein